MKFDRTLKLTGLNLVKQISHQFSIREKFLISVSILFRMSLVVLDLIGILLVGGVASMLSGATISSTSQFGLILTYLDDLGIKNSYAFVLGAAMIFFILKSIFSLSIIRVTSVYLSKVEVRIAREVFEKFLALPLEKIQGYTREQIMFSVTQSVTSASTKAILIGSSLVTEFTLLFVIAIFLSITHLQLFLLVTTFFAFVGWFLNRVVTNSSGRISRTMHVSMLASQGIALGAFENFRQIAMSRNRLSLVSKFTESRQRFARESAEYQTLTNLPRYITEIAIIAGGAILVVQRASFESGGASATVIAIFLAAMFRIVASLIPLQAALGSWKTVEFESRDALDLLNSKGTLGTGTKLVKRGSSSTLDIEFKNVSFDYSLANRPIIRQINLKINHGEFLAIVGKSGSGKSTFADLLLGLRAPTTGQVLIGGVDSQIYTRDNPGLAGYVPQTTHIFSGTLRENISLNFGSISDSEEKKVLRAAEIAGLTNFINNLPKNLDTPIGVKAQGLSGGETQRIGLARALYENPSILVLDEATSALDSKSQEEILGSLMALKGKITLVIIAHRLETIQLADRVLELENGIFKTVR